MNLNRSGLPAAVQRFLEASYPEDVPEPATLVTDATGRLRLGRWPRLPMRTRVSLIPGAHRVMDIAVRIGPVTLLHGLDAYVDGHGFTKAVGAADIGEEFDQGAFHALVLESLGLPHSWPRLRFAWESLDDDTAILRVPFKDGVETPTVRFDPTSGFPATFEVARHKGRGPKVDWRVDIEGWRRFGSVWEPEVLAVRWMDEPGPWFTLQTRQVVEDADVGDALERARVVLARTERG